MTREQIAARLERFVRANFGVADGDPGFSRSARLFEEGYVDSVGVVEVLTFLQAEFGVEIPDEALAPEHFESIDDIARVVAELKGATPA
jgi:acyl carrier protein